MNSNPLYYVLKEMKRYIEDGGWDGDMDEVGENFVKKVLLNMIYTGLNNA